MEEATSWEEFFSRFKAPKEFHLDYQYHIDFDRHYLFTAMRVENSRNPGQMITVSRKDWLEPFALWGQRYALEFVRRCIHDLAIHEIDENIRYDGELIFDPHANERV